MSAYKEIVTKAVVGKGKKYYRNTYTINTDSKPNTVLGCWVINHRFSGKEVDDRIEIDGSFDVNLWYSYDNDTKTSVITKNIPYKEMVTVAQKETTDSSSKDIIVRSLKQPSCISAKEKDNTIVIDIEKELGVEIVGDTKVKIAIEEDMNTQFKAYLRYLELSKYTYEDNKYIIFPAPSIDDLKKEGLQQGNCVGSMYLQPYINSKTEIFFMRDIEKVDKSLITLEFKNGHIVQKELPHHSQKFTEEQNTFINNWVNFRQFMDQKEKYKKKQEIKVIKYNFKNMVA